MRLRVNNGRSTWFDKNTYIEPIITEQPLIVAIDQSKTNCAIIIGTKNKKILHIAECSGNDKDFYDKPANTTEYCAELDDYLCKLLKMSTLIGFWQEAPINPWKKKKGGDSSGYAHYKSQMVLTEIRATLLRISQKLTGRDATEVINTDWKGRILPDGYRGQNEKGSHRYWATVDPKWLYYSHDVTDVLCIYLCAIQDCEKNDCILCVTQEESKFKYGVSIVDSFAVPNSAKQFTFNSKLTCDENATYYANRASGLGAAKLDIMSIQLSDLYKYAVNLYTMSEPYLLVRRL